MNAVVFFEQNLRVLGALIIREIQTRFGREGLGFLWLIGEPLIFCMGVMVIWSLRARHLAPGVSIGAFVMTGYMSLLLIRHHLSMSMGALQANSGLLYHRKIRPFHIFLARNIMELGGNTAAFIVVYVILLILGQVKPPSDWLLLYSGWLLLSAMAFGFGLIIAGLAMRFELVDRLSNLIGYLMIPISGVFFMVSWLPPAAREIYLLIPFPHAIEMIRASVFGEFVVTYYDPVYASVWAAIFVITGLVLVSASEPEMEV
jgi:capsular polysaccharide transport system permease protein